MSDDTILRELTTFIQHNTRESKLSCVDDIVMSYIKSALEELSDVNDQEKFDVEQFVEVMTAYIPEFEKIDSSIMCEWLFSLSEKLQGAKVTEQAGVYVTIDRQCKVTEDSRCTTQNNAKALSMPGKLHQFPSSLNDPQKLDMILEIFPGLEESGAMKALKKSAGDVEHAIENLLSREKIPVKDSKRSPLVKTSDVSSASDVKDFILTKYSFVDVCSDETYHKPCLPKQESKKLTRYRDGKIVNNKGEKFSDIKSEEEDDDMKKTYINLKPARKYRFH